MRETLDAPDFPIEKIFLVSGGMERGLELIDASKAKDASLDKVFLVRGGMEMEMAVVSSTVLPVK